MIHRRLIAKGIKYYLTLPHNAGHGIHSPFLFRLVTDVFGNNSGNNVLRKIEIYRENLLDNSKKIDILDLGAHGKKKAYTKKIKDIAKGESVSAHYGKLLYNLVAEFKPDVMLELGTCLGIGTMYMASGNPAGKVYSIEGSFQKASLASSMLQSQVQNVEVVTGSFEEQLPNVLRRTGKVDFAFIDGNHEKERTLYYFNEILKFSNARTVMVFDDISWSAGMMEAWDEIQQHDSVRVSMDLFRMGIILLDPKLQKENFKIFY